MKSKQDLQQFGFSDVGTWQIYPRRKSGVRTHLTAHRRDRVIYAFLVDGVCKYVGVCETPDTMLADRMERYAGTVGNGTNKRVCELIQKSLASGQAVEIMALKPEASFEFAGLSVDLIKGLENPLIQWADPEWNIKGKSSSGAMRYVSIDSLTPKKSRT